MPYAPGVRFDPSPIERGFAAAGDEVKQAIQKREQNAKEIDFLAGQVQAAEQLGALSPEDVVAFQTGTLSKKREIGSQAGLLLKDRILQQQMDIHRQNNLMDYEIAKKRLEPEAPFQPSVTELTLPDGGKVPFVQTSRGSGQIYGGNKGAEQVTPEMQAEAAAAGYTWLQSPDGGYDKVKLDDRYEVDADPELQAAVESWQNYSGDDKTRRERIRQLEAAQKEGQKMDAPTPGLSVSGAKTLGDELRILKRFDQFRDEVQRRGQSPLGKWLQGGGAPMRKVRDPQPLPVAPKLTSAGDALNGAVLPDAGTVQDGVLPPLPEPESVAADAENPNEMVTVVDVATGQTGKIMRKQVPAALASKRFRLP